MWAGVVVVIFLAAEGERYRFQEPHMGTLFRIQVYAPDQDKAAAAARAAFARVAELNSILSDYDPKSELMRLCAQAGGEPVKVSGPLFTVLARAQQVSRDSQGAFDVTIGPVVALWRKARRNARLPDATALQAARALVDWRQVVLDPDKQTVQLKQKGMRLDLGGIAKGYAADEMLAILRKQGLNRALIAAGGDLRAGDAPPGKSGWTVAIQPIEPKGDPTKEGPRYLSLVNAAVSTSGDAEQFIEIDGVRYSHIVDPRTGLGLPGRVSATVVAPDGITADSLATALAILGSEKGFALLAKTKGVSGRLVTKTADGTKVAVSPGFPTLRESGDE
ncbi:MAG: FAD:protein FMN transferase [Gemmataceae bacterium]